MLPIGWPPFKDSLPCSVQSSRKGLMLKWSHSPAPEQNIAECIFHAIFSLWRVSDFANFFLILNLNFAYFQCQNISMSRKTTPYSSTASSTARVLLQMICSLCYQNHLWLLPHFCYWLDTTTWDIISLSEYLCAPLLKQIIKDE